MDLTLILFGLSIMWLFMFKIEWLFNNAISFWSILIYSLLLFGLSFILLNVEYGNPKMVKVLKMPLISFVIFRGLYFLFKKIYKRNPENTFWVFQKKPVQDIIFTLLFWILGVGIPFFIV
jgi:hypothetical protein